MSKPMDTDPNIENRVGEYVKLRDFINQEDEAHKEKMKPHRQLLEEINISLLDSLNTIGVNSANTSMGTVYRSTKNSASIADGELFWKFVIENERFDLIDKRANVTAVADYIKENGVQPPGVNYRQYAVVGVRRK